MTISIETEPNGKKFRVYSDLTEEERAQALAYAHFLDEKHPMPARGRRIPPSWVTYFRGMQKLPNYPETSESEPKPLPVSLECVCSKNKKEKESGRKRIVVRSKDEIGETSLPINMQGLERAAADGPLALTKFNPGFWGPGGAFESQAGYVLPHDRRETVMEIIQLLGLSKIRCDLIGDPDEAKRYFYLVERKVLEDRGAYRQFGTFRTGSAANRVKAFSGQFARVLGNQFLTWHMGEVLELHVVFFPDEGPAWTRKIMDKLLSLPATVWQQRKGILRPLRYIGEPERTEVLEYARLLFGNIFAQSVRGEDGVTFVSKEKLEGFRQSLCLRLKKGQEIRRICGAGATLMYYLIDEAKRE